MVNSASAKAPAVEASEPNDTFGVLEFRIAPPKFGHRRGPSPLTRQQIEQYSEDLADNGPSASIKRDDAFTWMEVMEGVKLPGNLIIAQYDGSEYLLVHNRPPFVMSSATGWGLRSLTEDTTDNMGRPAIGFQFDSDGADRFYYLTSANVGRSLAIIIEGKLVSAPRIESAIRSQAVITGDFTTEQINDMTKALQKIVRPISTPAKTPASKPVQRPLRTYLIPALIFVLAVSIVGFFVYR
jgi:preprotein translocase subunit SecD